MAFRQNPQFRIHTVFQLLRRIQLPVPQHVCQGQQSAIPLRPKHCILLTNAEIDRTYFDTAILVRGLLEPHVFAEIVAPVFEYKLMHSLCTRVSLKSAN